MHLFNFGKVILHSGEESDFKVDCDALTDEDWVAIGDYLTGTTLWPWSEVEGVPKGGLALAEVCEQYCANDGPLLIVDDVLSTGASMEEQRAGRDAIGFVVVARGECPDWITPMLRMDEFEKLVRRVSSETTAIVRQADDRSDPDGTLPGLTADCGQ